jgi:hypothetical protein
MSDSWINTYDAVFFVTISTLICGSFGLVVRYCLKSKCDEVNLCFGLIKVHRDIKAEIELEEKEIEAGLDNESRKSKD